MLLTLTMAVGDDSETLPCFFQREAARPMVSAALNSRRLAHAVTHRMSRSRHANFVLEIGGEQLVTTVCIAQQALRISPRRARGKPIGDCHLRKQGTDVTGNHGVRDVE
jgi:hypothetical protein